MKKLNFAILLASVALFAGCSSKPSCDDSDVVMLAKDILFENNHNTLVNINWKFISDHGKELMALKDDDFKLDEYANYKKINEDKLSPKGKSLYKKLKKEIDKALEADPITVMTLKEDEHKVQCKAQFFKDDYVREYTAQYTDDGQLYVEIDISK